jgi:hypothetical protein
MTPDFSNSAQKLARNPLGIIALFLLLVYGIAGLVFSVAAKGLDVSERRPLVWFLVLFPALVLGAFIWLVARHHTKLYAPFDYSDSEGFFRALKGLTIDEQRAKLDAEVKSLQVESRDSEPTEANPSKRTKANGSVSTSSHGHEDTAGTPPPPARHDGVAPANELVESSPRELREAYVLAEELAFRKLEAEFGLSVQRHLRFQGREIDGLILTPVRATAVEIKYVRSAKNFLRISDMAISHLLAVEVGEFGTLGPLRTLLVVVLDTSPSGHDRIREMLQRHVASRGINYRVYDLNALKAEFGVASA